VSSTEMLPREEPGLPLKRVSPDFTCRLMGRIRQERRRRTSNRMTVIVMAGLCLLGATWASVRRYSEPVYYDIPVATAKLRPVVTPKGSPDCSSPEFQLVRRGPARPCGNFVILGEDRQADVTVTPKSDSAGTTTAAPKHRAPR